MSDVDPEMRALIALARRVENPTLADRSRVRKRIAVTLGATLGAVASTASGAERAVESGTHFSTPSIPAAANAGAWLGVLKGTVGQTLLWLAVGTAVGGGAWYLAGEQDSPVVVTPATRLGPRRAAQADEPPVASKPVPAPAAADSTGAVREGAQEELEIVPSPREGEPLAAESRVDPSRPRAAASRATALPRLSLAEEARELSAVHAALHRGESAAALVRLEAMDRRRGGALREERLAARVLALCALGRVREAESSARRFQALAPESPLLPRLTASCAQRALGGER